MSNQNKDKDIKTKKKLTLIKLDNKDIKAKTILKKINFKGSFSSHWFLSVCNTLFVIT